MSSYVVHNKKKSLHLVIHYTTLPPFSPGRHSCELHSGPAGVEAPGGSQEEEQGRHGPQAVPHQGPSVGVCQLSHREPHV